MAQINEFSYEGAAGEFIEVAVAAGTDVSSLSLEIYVKSGASATLSEVLAVSSGSFSTDGAYDYYLIYTVLKNGPRDAIALVDAGVVIDSVAWGVDSSFQLNGGSLDGQTIESIGAPLSSSSTTSLSRSDSGGWVESTPSPGTTNITCFCGETRIETAQGLLPAHRIKPGVLVRTLDHGLQPVQWVGRQWITPAELTARHKLLPICVDTGALGQGLPERPLRLSRQHRLLVSSRIAHRMSGQSELLIRAAHLVGLPGIGIDSDNAARRHGILYVHLLLERHEILFAEGAPAESLLLAVHSMAILDQELPDAPPIFPAGAADWGGHAVPARPMLSGARGKRLLWRHRKNAVPLLCERAPRP